MRPDDWRESTPSPDALTWTAMDLPHALELERRALQALQDGNPQEAYRLIDRRCRMGSAAAPYCLVLRAEALDRMGRRELAMADIALALRVAPEDVPASRRMMLWADGDECLDAATTVVRRDSDPAVRAQAFALLEMAGRQTLAELEAFDRSVAGWVTWDGPDEAHVEIVDGQNERRWRVAPASSHPFGGRGHFARFDLLRPSSDRVQSARVIVADRPLMTIRMAPNQARQPSAHRSPTLPPRGAGVSVVVPVYADDEATRACLDSVLASFGPSTPHSLIVVDDASPDRRLSDHLRDLADAGSITLLVNRQNLGFVGAVNRALDTVHDGDVVLLNADTVVPPGFVDRLAAAAHAAPHIGTVTPFSNNGEFLSFPRPNRSNPLPSPEDIRCIDAAAATTNAGQLIDLPSGIGFCLYVTRACLDAVGGLSEDYHRGYLEDVDFCLRGRASGFRNVADPSVFVGHAGSRSFATNKRALVVRNLAILERRFPDHRAESAAFMAADPLRKARDRIERRLRPSAARPIILVVSASHVRAVAHARARQLTEAECPAFLVEASGGPESVVRLSDPGGAAPQSLQFALPGEHAALKLYLEGLDSPSIELFDAHRLPASLVSILGALGSQVDLVLADGSLLPTLGLSDLVPACWPATSLAARDGGGKARLPPFDRVVPLSLEAKALLGSFPLPRAPRSFARPARPLEQAPDTDPHLGFIPMFHGPYERDLIDGLARAILARAPHLSLTVLGSLCKDERLAHRDQVFVTGSIDDADLDRIRAAHGVTALMVLLSRPVFGHPTLAAAYQCRCPVACIDWTSGRLLPAPGDLAIGSGLSLDAAAESLVGWLTARQEGAETPALPGRYARC